MNLICVDKNKVLGEGWGDLRTFDQYSLFYAAAPHALNRETEEWLVSDLIKAMPDLKLAEYFQIKKNWFSDYDYLIAAAENESDELVGLLTSRWHEKDGAPFFLQISMQMIATRYQKTQLLKHMWGFHFQKVSEGPFGFPSVIALRTYNPVVFSAMRIFSRIEGIRMYPQLRVEEQDLEMVALAHSITERISPGLNMCSRTGVIKDASVPPDFYPSLPKTSKGEVYNYFAEHLSPSDRLLCVLHISTEEGKRKISKAFGARA
jgi:hypothetical protein